MFPIIRQFLKYTLKRADGVTAVSQALKSVIAKLGRPENSIRVIPNGVSRDRFYPISKTEARRSLGFPPERKVILSVGHLTPNKGFDLIIKGLKILFDQFNHKNLYLVIVGDGTAKVQLKTLVSSLRLDEHVLFAGGVSHDDLHIWYSAADVMCLASKMEGWPNVLLEALACGTPVVGTTVGGIPEIIRSEEIGRLTERNESKIAEAIHSVVIGPVHLENLVEYARKHTWEYTALTLREEFKGVLRVKRRLSKGNTNCVKGTTKVSCRRNSGGTFFS
jgi:glycosyltransferase involved in cell wall biosynthesis